MKKFAVAIVLSAACAAPALAAPGAYISVDYGPVSYTNSGGFPNPSTLRFAVGSNVNPNFGVEVGYSILGNSTLTGPGGTATVESTSSLQFLAVGILPVSPEFEIFGKLGMASNGYTLNANIPGVAVGSASYSKTALAYGLGIKYNATPEIAIQAQYLNLGAFDTYSLPLKATTTTVGVVIGF